MASPEAFRGYWNQAELTGRVVRDGWYFSGDVAVTDDDGDYWVVDRIDDLIVVGDRKMYPSDVEAVLRRHPAVHEALVTGWVNPAGAVRIVAYVVPAAPGVRAGDLLTYCRSHSQLAASEQPHEIRFVRALPRQAGKVARRALAMAGSGDMRRR
jgi:acyl-coenzyme A synthetase/AMP-(fatty) acid ligase